MRNSNQPAHPYNKVEETDRSGGAWTKWKNYDGLTKREYFATMAMQGLLATYNNMYIESPESKPDVAKRAVEFADALLTELEKQSNH